MVKNTSGGSKTKSFARKLHHEPDTFHLRLPTNEFEVIGCVYKMLGNGRMVVRTAHSKMEEIQCVIRNKFRGRAKRNHIVGIGTFVLIGLYDWEAPNFKSSDLLHVYSHENIAALKSNPAYSLSTLDSFVSQFTTTTAEQDFMFSTEDSDTTEWKSGGGGGGEGGGGGGSGGESLGTSAGFAEIDFDDI